MSSSDFSLSKKETSLISLKKNARFKVALVFPNSYSLGMSNLGIHAIYDIFNKRDDTLCERVFFEKNKKQFLSLENQRGLKEFDIIAFSISYELDYLNFFAMLNSIFPVSSIKKRAVMPMIIAGGIVNSFNAKAISEFCDCIFVGESEESLPAFMDKLALTGQINSKEKKLKFLNSIASIEGIFVPGMMQASRVKPAVVIDINKFPTSSKILTPFTEFSNTFLVEISRGCPWKCNFCVTGAIFSKFRPRRFGVIKSAIDDGLEYTSKIGLVGAAITEHPQIETIVNYLEKKKARISISSLRIETVSSGLLEALALSGQKTVTFAPEAGSDKLRFMLNKKITNEQIIKKIILAKRSGIKKVKLYFIIGLPRETNNDIVSMARLIREVGELMPLKVNIGIFVPKPETPFANEVFQNKKSLENKIRLLRENLHFDKNTVLNISSIKQAMLEALFSHADEHFFNGFLQKNLSQVQFLKSN